ncbi:MAG: hypothetical protein RBU27_07645 [Bacteroidota bacterium]|nr:hypothetical protein [Bacteroidota bacterium]
MLLLVAFVAMHAGASAQVVTLSTELLRDDIPATIQRSRAAVTWQPAAQWVSETGYRYVFADQDPFNGLPRLRPALHALDQTIELRLPSLGLRARAMGTLSRIGGGAYYGDYELGLRYTAACTVVEGGLPLRLALRAAGGRERNLSVSTALMENVGMHTGVVEADVTVNDVLQLVGNAGREWYLDGNRKDVAYFYALLHAMDDPKVAVGYAYSWADSDRSSWSMTGSTFNPRQREYSYSYFYFPYFTPLNERGHLLIALVQWPLAPWLLVHGKVSLPVWSRGSLKWMPESGNTAIPNDYHVTYDIDDILPTQIDGGCIVQWSPALAVDLGVSSFSKPYYQYIAGRLTLLYAPFAASD